jgi:hypothetical protein
MSTTSSTRSVTTTKQRRPATIVSLAVLLCLLVVGAAQGGIAMVSDPLEPLGMPVSYLEDTPINSYLLPGLFLLAIAAAATVTIVGLIFAWRWPWAHGIEAAVGYRWPWLGALSIGSVLLVFEIMELFMVPVHPVMHPLLIAASLAIITLILTPSARDFLRVGESTA